MNIRNRKKLKEEEKKEKRRRKMNDHDQIMTTFSGSMAFLRCWGRWP